MAQRVLTCLSLFAAAVLANTTVLIPGVPKGADPLFRFTEDGKVGFMDPAGRVVIAPTLRNAGDFFGGFAVFREGGKSGFINARGEKVIPAMFDDARPFSEGLAAVRMGKSWGYINDAGGFVVEPRFQAAGPMQQGLARVASWNALTCLGRPLDELSNTQAEDYYFVLPDQQSGSRACWPKNIRFGFVDRTGKLAIPQRFSYAYDFADGRARVKLAESGDLYGYIDRQGRVVVKPQFPSANDFSEGMAAVEINGPWGYIDVSDHAVIAPQFECAGDFSEGLATVCGPDGEHHGYIDRKGKYVIRSRFRWARAFSEGLAFVSEEETTNSGYFIDKTGKRQKQISIRNETWFAHGLAIAEQNGRLLYIDRSGKVIGTYQ